MRRQVLVLLLLSLLLVSIVETKKKKGKEAKKPDTPRKPWKEMTKEDWDRLEREADEAEEDEDEEPKKKAPMFDPSDPKAFMSAARKGKTEMSFTVLRNKDSWTAKDTEELVGKWKALMQTNAVAATPYVIEPGYILWQSDGSVVDAVADFTLSQPETDHFEFEQQKRYPPKTEL
mmetsp:Transcript_63551/g.150584  ORF Transcript_63551/g.150584 Transcript_63551/m.150584 type:complete len:175 (-) Transcript_63551:27-551(-)